LPFAYAQILKFAACFKKIGVRLKGGYVLKIAAPPVLIKLYSASAEQSLSKF